MRSSSGCLQTRCAAGVHRTCLMLDSVIFGAEFTRLQRQGHSIRRLLHGGVLLLQIIRTQADRNLLPHVAVVPCEVRDTLTKHLSNGPRPARPRRPTLLQRQIPLAILVELVDRRQEVVRIVDYGGAR